jgi:hypothetical protein
LLVGGVGSCRADYKQRKQDHRAESGGDPHLASLRWF